MPETDPYLVPKSPAEKVQGIAQSAGIASEIANDYLKLTHIESGQNQNAGTSSKGAKGFGQVMPDVKGGRVRTIGNKKYDLTNEAQNIEAGLTYFSQGGDDPVARRLHYFGGPGAANHYRRTGKIPDISDGNMTASQYVKATGGWNQAPQDPYLVPKKAAPVSAPSVDDPYLVAKPDAPDSQGRGAGMARAPRPKAGALGPVTSGASGEGLSSLPKIGGEPVLQTPRVAARQVQQHRQSQVESIINQEQNRTVLPGDPSLDQRVTARLGAEAAPQTSEPEKYDMLRRLGIQHDQIKALGVKADKGPQGLTVADYDKMKAPTWNIVPKSWEGAKETGRELVRGAEEGGAGLANFYAGLANIASLHDTVGFFSEVRDRWKAEAAATMSQTARERQDERLRRIIDGEETNPNELAGTLQGLGAAGPTVLKYAAIAALSKGAGAPLSEPALFGTVSAIENSDKPAMDQVKELAKNVATGYAFKGLNAVGAKSSPLTQRAITGAGLGTLGGTEAALTGQPVAPAVTSGIALGAGLPAGREAEAKPEEVVRPTQTVPDALQGQLRGGEIDRALAAREGAVKPVTDAQGNVLLNPDEVAQGGKPKIKLANSPADEPAHLANFRDRAKDGTFVEGEAKIPDEFKPENVAVRTVADLGLSPKERAQREQGAATTPPEQAASAPTAVPPSEAALPATASIPQTALGAAIPKDANLTEASRSGSVVYFEFDAMKPVPTKEQMQAALSSEGIRAEVIRYAPGLVSGARGTVRFRADIMDEQGRMSSKAAEKTYQRLFGTGERVSGKPTLAGILTPEEQFKLGVSVAKNRDLGTSITDPRQAPPAQIGSVEPPPEVSQQPTHPITREGLLANEKGEPLTVYHGTTSPVGEFDASKAGEASRGNSAVLGTWFTDDPSVAEIFTAEDYDVSTEKSREGANIIPAHIKLRNPKVISAAQFEDILSRNPTRADFEKAKQRLIEQGHDGLIIEPHEDTEGNFTEFSATNYVAFDPAQIKFTLQGEANARPSTTQTNTSQARTPDSTVRAKEGLSQESAQPASVESLSRSNPRTGDIKQPPSQQPSVSVKEPQPLPQPEARPVPEAKVESAQGETKVKTPKAATPEPEKPVIKLSPRDQKPGSSKPLITKPREPSTTSARKAQMSSDRDELDLPELPPAERKGWQKSLDNARDRLIIERADLLAAEVLKKPRALNDEETAGLVLRAQQLKNEHVRVMKEIGDATDPSQIAAKNVERGVIESAFDKITEATKKSGTEKGRSLASQKLTISQDYDLVSVVQRMKAAKGRELSTDERTKYEGMVKERDQAILDRDAALERAHTAELQRQINRTTRQRVRAETKESLDKEAAMIKSNIAAEFMRLKGTQSSTHSLFGLGNLDPEGVITRELVKYARNRVKANVGLKAEALIDEAHGLVKDFGVTRRQVAEVLSGYMKPRDREVDAATRRLAEIRSEIKTLLAQQDVAAGVRTEKAQGPPRRLFSRNAVRLKQLQKQEADITQRLAARDFSPRKKAPPLPYTQEVIKAQDRVTRVENEFRREADRADPWHYLRDLSGIRKAGMLSGYITHIRNIAGTGAHVGFEEVRRLPSVVLDAAMSSVTGRRTVTLSPSASLDGVIQALTVGRREAKEILKHGASLEQMEKQQFHEINTGVKAVDVAFNSIYRFMSASDRVFYQGTYKRNLVERAQSQAITERRADKSIDVKERARELTREPPAEMDADAKHDALVATFNNSNKLSNAIKSGRGRLGPVGNFAVDMVLPFDRTPTNVIARVIEASPAGYAKNAKQIAMSLWRGKMTGAEQRAISETFGRATAGTSIVALGFALAAKGLLTTDEYGTTYLEFRGHKINLSAVAPMGTLLGIGAGLQKQRAKAPSKRGYAGAILKPLADQPLLRATSQVSDAVKDPERSLTRTAASMAFSFVPMSGAVRAVATGIDPADKRYPDKSFKQQFQQNIPRWREGLPAIKLKPRSKGAFKF